MTQFNLSNQPLAYVLSIHIVNIIETPNIDEETILMHIQNLINTYGSIQIEFLIKDLFPQNYSTILKGVA